MTHRRFAVRRRPTARQLEILGHLYAGHDTRGAARLAGCSRRTAESHLRNLYEVLGVRGPNARHEAYRVLGWIPTTPPDEARMP